MKGEIADRIWRLVIFYRFYCTYFAKSTKCIEQITVFCFQRALELHIVCNKLSIQLVQFIDLSDLLL